MTAKRKSYITAAVMIAIVLLLMITDRLLFS